MDREPDYIILHQQRAYDSRKESWVWHETREKADRAVDSAMEFRRYAEQFPHARRRFYYRINVYLKDR